MTSQDSVSAPAQARLRRALPALMLLGLTACSTSTGIVKRYPGNYGSEPAASTSPSYGSSTAADADAALARGDAAAAARSYQAAAADATPEQAADLRLRAADASLAARDPFRADQILDQIPAQTSDPVLQTRYRLLRAQSALMRNDSARALRLLPAGDPGGDPQLAERQLLVRAQAQARGNDPIGLTQSLVLREHYLNGIVALNANRETLWNLLQGATLDAATLGRAASQPPLVRGWLDLAALHRRRATLGEFDLWRKRYPRHPGEERLAALYAPSPSLTMAPALTPAEAAQQPLAPYAPLGTAPNNGLFPDVTAGAPLAHGRSIALLLPQTGPQAAFADALRAGYASAASAGSAPPARIYEPSAYGQAVSDGAGVVVGPLLKENLTVLAQSPALPVPVLGLNYLDGNRIAPPGLYQFGLAPEDEARAAAEDAVSRGLRRALSMTPSSDWGNRVQSAFETRLRELGGVVVDSGRYYGEPQAWADPVRKLLRYVAIDDKKKAAEARAKAGPDIDPQRRNDFDFVFIGARASQARVLWPLFRYYHADRTPVYATSAVNEGPGDGDLSGIRFCDVPWLLDGISGALQPLRDAAQNGRSREAARFYAFGADAWLLANRIAQNALRPGDLVQGATGALAVETNGAIRRKLVCARMTNGGDPSVMAPGIEPALNSLSPPP
ncbi:penicillin-binding protein activator [Nevskia ramosa]|uniref:penicillin-binding protein activator n=1 Tax=Nevskia ramosa TaxID=64002 RepID=UPI000A041C09|nr:penicillin-binding protein activator [Nevskia ramosa]